MATPQLQQFFSSSTNPNGIGGDAGSNFQFTMQSPIGAGNMVELVVSFPNGTTVTISDNNGNTWPASPNGGHATNAGGFDLARWILLNANAGLTQITIGVGATAIQPVSWECSEWNNIPSSAAIDGTPSATTNLSGTSLAAGSITTTQAGDLILAAFYPNGNVGGNPTSWTAGSGFTLQQADIAWSSAQGFPKASEYQIQSSAGAINPAITITGDATDTFNGIACAVKTTSAGTQYTGMRILKRMQFCNNNQAASPWKLQAAFQGNLRAFTNTTGSASVNFSAITDTDSSTWTSAGFKTDSCQCLFAQGTSASPAASGTTMTVTISAGLPNGIICNILDIVGAANTGQPGATASTDLALNATTSAPHEPDFTPQSSNGSLIVYLLQNQGTGSGSGGTTGIGPPTGAVNDMTLFTGRTGGNQYDFGDGWGHLNNNTSTATQNVTWTLVALAGNNLSSAAIEFLPPAGTALGKWPSQLLLPPRRGMAGWRGLSQPRAYPVAVTTAALSGIAVTQAKSLGTLTGAASLRGSAETMAQVRAQMGAAAALAAKAATQTKASAAMTGAAALGARTTTMAKASAGPSGTVPLAGQAATQAKALGSILFATFLSARATTMAMARAAAAGSAAMSARATTAATARAGFSGAAALSGFATTVAKAAGAISTGGFVALSGMVTTMAQAAGRQAGALALAAHLTAQTKAAAASPVQPPASQVGHVSSSMGAKLIQPIGVS